jgi:outer membrane receptor protein involved in Fe transport
LFGRRAAAELEPPHLIKNILVLILVFASAVAAFAQAREITGQVRDQAGAAIVGATVTIVIGGTERQTTTDDTGTFRFSDIDSFNGRIRVSANGFTVQERLIAGPVIEIVLSVSSIMDTITVTRTEARLSDTPQSVIVISERELGSDPAPTVDDKLRQVPGFTLFRRSGSRTANPTSQGVSLRGAGGSGASRAAVTADGFPLNDPFGGWIYWGRVPAVSISSIEVLRGSAGEVFGSSAIGGVIELKTRKASRSPLFDLDLSAGSHGTGLGSLFAAAGRGKWNGSIAAEGFRTDGFIAIAEPERGAVDSPAGVKRAGLVPYIEYLFGQDSRVFLTGEYFQERRANGTPVQTNDTKILSPRFGMDLTSPTLGEVKFRGWYLSQRYHQSFSSIAADRNSELITRLQTVPSRSMGATFQWAKTFSARVSVFAGAEFRIVSGSSDEIAFVGGRAVSFLNTGGREFTIGAFTGGAYALTSRLVLSGGVRVDRWREFSGYADSRPVAGTVVTRGTFAGRSETVISPRVSALFRINNNVSITGTVSRGFRQPSLNELYRSFRVGNVQTLANQELKAERATTAEAGVLASAFADRMYLRAVSFCALIDQPVANVTLSITPSLITRRRQNLGSTRSCGLEADTSFRLTDNFSLSAGYLFADARVREFPSDTALEGLRVPQVPSHQFTLQARYSDPQVADINMQVRAATSQFDDDQNIFALRGFGSVDVFVARQLSRRFEIYLGAENIFDSKIEAGRTPVLALTGPRSLRAGLRIRLGRN